MLSTYSQPEQIWKPLSFSKYVEMLHKIKQQQKQTKTEIRELEREVLRYRKRTETQSCPGALKVNGCGGAGPHPFSRGFKATGTEEWRLRPSTGRKLTWLHEARSCSGTFRSLCPGTVGGREGARQALEEALEQVTSETLDRQACSVHVHWLQRYTARPAQKSRTEN